MVEICLHAANVFYLASFLGRDMLWLRLMTCIGLVLGIVFFTCQTTPMYGPSAWHVLFLAINALQVVRLLLDRRQLRLTDEQSRFSEARFGGLSREQLLTLLTRVTCEGDGEFHGLDDLGARPLGRDQAILRDLAFRHLTRQEILILLTRRVWHSLRRKKLARWRWQRRNDRGDAVARLRSGPSPESAAS